MGFLWCGFIISGGKKEEKKETQVFLLVLFLLGKSLTTRDYELLGSAQTDELPAESLHIKPFNHSLFTGLSTDERGLSVTSDTHPNTPVHMLSSCCKTHILKQTQVQNKNHNLHRDKHTPIRPRARTHAFNTNELLLKYASCL